MTPKNVLFSILNWGLGHASRSLPIIRQLLERGHQVTIASDGSAAHLLQQELPNLNHIALPNYDATYSARFFLAQHLRLAARSAKAILAEQKVLKSLMDEEPFDVIISDNRYGTFHPKATNVIITHQLNIPLAAPLRKLVSGQIRRYVQKFDFCWIPDLPGKGNLSGKMSEGHLKIPKRFIGPQSRFDLLKVQETYELAVILSGPEPQRSVLQEEIFKQLQRMEIHAIVVLGAPDSATIKPELDADIEVYPLLTSEVLNKKICQSKKVLSRSGYSTIMDLMKLSKPAILIPTPGQPEQNYLANLHKTNPQFNFQNQNKLNIELGIDLLDQMEATNETQTARYIDGFLDAALKEIGL